LKRSSVLTNDQLDYLRNARVARLGTIDDKGLVHLVPIVFAILTERIYFVVDEKAKVSKNLKRLKNIEDNPNVTLLVDIYSENWKKLSYLMLNCGAEILRLGKNNSERRLAASRLKEKYAQYAGGQYFPVNTEEAVFVRLTPIQERYWQNLRISLC